LRKIFGPERQEVTDGWREVLKKEVYNLYSFINYYQVVIARSFRILSTVTDFKSRAVSYV